MPVTVRFCIILPTLGVFPMNRLERFYWRIEPVLNTAHVVVIMLLCGALTCCTIYAALRVFGVLPLTCGGA
jgi:hypothetical protein